MRLSKRDVVATVLVAAAGVVYGLWAVGSPLPGMSSARMTGFAVLALGFAASASAVVPGFDELIRGNKTYLGVTSLIGLVALAGGIVLLVAASETGLAVVMGAMGVLWLIATVHHGLLAEHAPRTAPTRPVLPHGSHPAGIA